jgi:hypothetical protein
MKNVFLALLILGSPVFLFGKKMQPDSINQVRPNVLVVNVSGWVHQFFPSTYLYSPRYTFGYRKFFGANAARVNINGRISTSGEPGTGYFYRTSFFLTGLGYERHVQLSKRWSLYGGGDLVFSNYKTTDDYFSSYYNQQYYYSYKTRLFGLSPLLGIVVRLKPYLSFGTETGCLLGYVTTKRFDILPVEQYTSGNSFAAVFIPPTSLFLRIQI